MASKLSDRLAATGDGVDGRLAEVDRRIDANYPELTEEERATIKQRAREHVLKVQQERVDDARQKLVEKATERALRDAEKEVGLHGAYVDIQVDLAPNAPWIMLDGTFYYHGMTYEVPANVAATIADISARSWEHENEIHGRPRRADMGRRQTLRVLGPAHQTQSAASINSMPVV